jgi:hypothetical protein
MRLPNITGYFQAAAGNYQPGRGKPIRCFTVHHSAGWEQTLRYLWGDPARGASSTFYVSGSVREQYVDTDDTPYTNGNFPSNQESLTCEVRGDWRNGYYDQATLNNLTEVMYQCLKIWPGLVLTFHKDVSSSVTLCPADLKDKGYAAACWQNAKNRIAQENAPVTPPATAISYKKITPKRIRLIRTANLWNFNFSEWAKAQAVKVYGANELIDVVAIATNALGGKYYMTAYSYNDGNIRSTNGFNVVDCEDYVPPAETPAPAPTPTWQTMQNPRKMRAQVDLKVYDLTNKTDIGDVIPAGTDIDLVDIITDTDGKVYVRSKWAHDNNKNWGILANKVADIPAPTVPDPEPVPPKPIDTDPTTPGNGDVETRLSALERAVKYILDFLAGLFSGFKFNK